MKTLVVTGGMGFIGSNFIHYWLNKYKTSFVVNLDSLTYAGNPRNLDDLKPMQRRHHFFIHGNICNAELVTWIFNFYKPQMVVNFAAESHNSRGVLNPNLFFRTNLLGTQTLLECARKAEVPRFHHISTCEVYGDMALDAKEKFTEESPYRPNTPYNASKAAADMAVRVYFKTYNLPVTVSNCCNNYGPYQFPEKVIPLFVTNLLQEKNIPIYKHSKNKREWIHVLDHCRAIDLILHKGKLGETYNVGTGEEVTVDELADHILRYMAMHESYKTYVEDRPGHDRRYLLDSSKIKRLGWKPRIAFDDGLEKTIKWYIKHDGWWKNLLSIQGVEEGSWKKPSQ